MVIAPATGQGVNKRWRNHDKHHATLVPHDNVARACRQGTHSNVFMSAKIFINMQWLVDSRANVPLTKFLREVLHA